MADFAHISLDDIDAPPLPARVSMDEGKMAELMESMSAIGLIQPIALIRRNGRYEIEAGHRRFMAAQGLKWPTIPAVVYQPSEIAEGAAMLAENMMREDLSAAEEAILFAQSQERFSLDEAGLCARFRRSPDYIADRLRLLRDDEQVFRALLQRDINFSVARELNKCEDIAHRHYLLDAAVRGGASARVVAGWVQQWRANQQPATAANPVTVAASEPAPVDPYRPVCGICGGDRDPWNLVNVTIHKWEWEQIQKGLEHPPEGD